MNDNKYPVYESPLSEKTTEYVEAKNLSRKIISALESGNYFLCQDGYLYDDSCSQKREVEEWEKVEDYITFKDLREEIKPFPKKKKDLFYKELKKTFVDYDTSFSKKGLILLWYADVVDYRREFVDLFVNCFTCEPSQDFCRRYGLK